MQPDIPDYPDLAARWDNVKGRLAVTLLPDGTYRTYLGGYRGPWGHGGKWAINITDTLVYAGPEQGWFLTRAEAENLIQEGERRLANDKLQKVFFMSNATGVFLGTPQVAFDWEKYYLNVFVPVMKSFYFEPTVPQIIRDRMGRPNSFSEFNALPTSEQARRVLSKAVSWAGLGRGVAPPGGFVPTMVNFGRVGNIYMDDLVTRTTSFFKFWRHIFDLKYSGKPVYKVVKKFWGTIVEPAVDDPNKLHMLVFRDNDWIYEHPLDEYDPASVMWGPVGPYVYGFPDITLDHGYVMVSPGTEMTQAEWDQRVANAMKDAELEAGITDGKLTLPATTSGRPAVAAPRPGAVPVVAKPKDRTLLYAGLGAGAGLLGAVVIAVAGGRRR